MYNIFMELRKEVKYIKTGRPKISDPKDVDVKVRLDKNTNQELLKYCSEHDITRAEAIRQGIHLLLQKK